MRKEAKEFAIELARLELQLQPLLQRRSELRTELQRRLPIGDREVIDGFLFHAYEKLSTSFDEAKLIASLGKKAEMVTVPKLDSSKLDAALRIGAIKSTELEPFVTVSTSKVLLVRPSNGNNHNEKGAKERGERSSKAV